MLLGLMIQCLAGAFPVYVMDFSATEVNATKLFNNKLNRNPSMILEMKVRTRDKISSLSFNVMQSVETRYIQIIT